MTNVQITQSTTPKDVIFELKNEAVFDTALATIQHSIVG